MQLISALYFFALYYMSPISVEFLQHRVRGIVQASGQSRRASSQICLEQWGNATGTPNSTYCDSSEVRVDGQALHCIALCAPSSPCFQISGKASSTVDYLNMASSLPAIAALLCFGAVSDSVAHARF